MTESVLVRRPRRVTRLSGGAATGTQIFHACCWLWFVAFFILPDGCGFRLGFLWSAKRIMMFVCYAMIIFNKRRLTLFWHTMRKCIIGNTYIVLYEFVRVYTAVYRTDLYCIMGSVLDELMVFYLFYFIFKNSIITLPQFLKFIRVTLVILTLEGIWEAITGVNLFRFISFASDGWSSYGTRGGNSRVCGNCHHSIHFGIYLSILFLLSCYDALTNKLYLFRNPVIFLLTSVTVFLSGSRAPLGIYILSVFLICLFSPRNERIKSLIFLAAFLSVFSLFVMAMYKTEAGCEVMYMVTNMWDAIFGTHYAERWGGTLEGSTAYRDALAKVFQLDYFNKFVGRGAHYGLSVVIDGIWLQSCDNSYVGIYIGYAYPGLIMLIGHGVLMLLFSFWGLFKHRNYFYAATAVVTVCYFINIWYVAMMGTYMYIWCVFGLMCAFKDTVPDAAKSRASRYPPRGALAYR